MCFPVFPIRSGVVTDLVLGSDKKSNDDNDKPRIFSLWKVGSFI